MNRRLRGTGIDALWEFSYGFRVSSISACAPLAVAGFSRPRKRMRAGSHDDFYHVHD